MTAAQLRFWERVHRKATGLTKEAARAYFAGVKALQATMATRELNALVRAGAVDRFVALALSDENLNAAFSRFRAQVQLTTRDATAWFGKDIPGVHASGIGIAFDHLNPRVIDAVRSLDTKVMTRLATETREVVRAYLEQGLRTGAAPATTARALRELIGLGPTQVQEVANFRAALEAGDVAKAFGYRARDRRFDASIEAGRLTPEKIDRIVEAYTKRRVAINAETTARTATVEAMKVGQQLSWEDAREKGVIPEGYVMMQEWMTVMDGRERPEHHAMNGQVAPLDGAFSNGDSYPGEGDPWNCRCLARVFLARAA